MSAVGAAVPSLPRPTVMRVMFISMTRAALACDSGAAWHAGRANLGGDRQTGRMHEQVTRHRFGSVGTLTIVVSAVILVSGWIAMGINSDPAVRSAATIFVGVFVQATPFVVLGSVISGLIGGFVSAHALARALPQRRGVAVIAAGVSGAALPGCECSAVPVVGRLRDRGVPDAVALTFLLAAPAVNPVVVISTAIAFPQTPMMAVARLTASLAAAILVGWFWLWIGKPEWIRRPPASKLAAELPARLQDKANLAAATARHDLVDSAAYLAIGALAAAALHTLVPTEWIDHLAGNLMLAIIVMAALAVVMSLCSEADAFVAASLSALPLVPRLVFLVVGPAVDIKLMAMQGGSFGWPFVARFAPACFLVSVICGMITGVAFLGWR